MRAGTLNQRVTADRPVTAQDATGQEVVTWVPVATVWGAVEPLKGRERMIGDQMLGELDTRIRLRAGVPIQDINVLWRLRCNGVIYSIYSIADVKTAGRELEVLCLSGVRDG